MLKKWLKIALDLVYPPKCPACRRQTGREGEWCGECLANICADGQPWEIPPSQYKTMFLDGCLAVCRYQGVVKNLILDMKFSQKRQNGVKLAYFLENSLRGRHRSEVDFVVPVPLYAQKLKERGFNQTVEIFQPWAEKENLAWLDCLERIRSTKPQWNLTLQERTENVKGAFALTRLFDARPYLEGKAVLLVDDILTSGATIKECAMVLKEAGATRIFALAVCHG